MKIVQDNIYYDVQYLTKLWNAGWKNLADFASNSGWWKVPDREDWLPYCRIAFTADEIFDEIEEEYKACIYGLNSGFTFFLMGLIMFGNKRIAPLPLPCHSISRVATSERDDHVNANTLTHVLKLLRSSDNLDQVIKQLTTEENYEYLLQEQLKVGAESFEQIGISNKWRSGFDYLFRASTKQMSEDKAWWNCAWLMMESEIDMIHQIEKIIEADIPLSDDQIEWLNTHIQYGLPQVCLLHDSNGMTTYRIQLEQTSIELIHLYPLQAVSHYLLIQPTFIVVQRLQEKCKIPRYIGQCQAPSCEKRFYTGRKNVTACPAHNSAKKSPCALEWIRYNRFLKKIGKNPSNDWNDTQLKQVFISQDKP